METGAFVISGEENVITYVPVNFEDKFKAQWSPKVIVQMNDYQFKLVRVEGEFVWHDHPDADETFMVIAGELEIKFRDGSLTLKSGEMFVVPRGVEHCPVAEKVALSGSTVNARWAVRASWSVFCYCQLFLHGLSRSRLTGVTKPARGAKKRPVYSNFPAPAGGVKWLW